MKEKPSGSVKTGQFWTIINIVYSSVPSRYLLLYDAKIQSFFRIPINDERFFLNLYYFLIIDSTPEAVLEFKLEVLSKRLGLLSERSPLFVKKTSNFGQYFGRFEKLQVIGLQFASITHP